MSKIKIAWICHFSNKQVREKMPLSSLWFINVLRFVFGKKDKHSPNIDFAPWIGSLIKEIERTDDVELHVIAPHIGLKKLTYTFEMSGVHYHFFQPGLSQILDIVLRIVFRRPERKYRINRFLVKRFLKNIKPDIVNLFGAENPRYSITALDIKDTPVYVLLQTVLATPFNNKLNYTVALDRLAVEKAIFLKAKYFGTASRVYNDCVFNVNPNAIVFEFWFPTEKPPDIEDNGKEFEFVFFANQLTESKGVEDAIDAFAIVVRTFKNARLNIIGSCSAAYKDLLVIKISDLGLGGNIVFSSYFLLHSEMFKQVKKAKAALLPHKIDVIAGTIREAMFLGLPVITYKTTGTPFLNSEKQTVLISDIGDISGLAQNMIMLLSSPVLDQSLTHNAKILANKIFDNAAITKKLLEDNKAIINHYHLGTPIPEDLLFKPENFPIVDI
ncbi:MAG TPA: glycosyltransferase [Bacteroidales bacterium]|nr:glycosyltransferase [Bacteroidales bacterium]